MAPQSILAFYDLDTWEEYWSVIRRTSLIWGLSVVFPWLDWGSLFSVPVTLCPSQSVICRAHDVICHINGDTEFDHLSQGGFCWVFPCRVTFLVFEVSNTLEILWSCANVLFLLKLVPINICIHQWILMQQILLCCLPNSEFLNSLFPSTFVDWNSYRRRSYIG